MVDFDSAIFQDMDSFRKGRFSRWAIECFGFLFWELLEYPKCVQCHVIV